MPWIAGLNLGWEIAQLPLYTIVSEATPAYLAFSVLHCTAGDVLIAFSSLMAALILTGARNVASWNWWQIGAVLTAAGVGYTVYSEWANTAILGSWAYAERMPVVHLGGLRIGLSPLAQWLVLPPLALYLARRTAMQQRGGKTTHSEAV
jgi:hypothetical protein